MEPALVGSLVILILGVVASVVAIYLEVFHEISRRNKGPEEGR